MLLWFGAFLVLMVGGSPVVILLSRLLSDEEGIGIDVLLVVSVIAIAAALWVARIVDLSRTRGVSVGRFLAHIGIASLVAFVGIVAALWL
jgi:hypothetical protein